MNISLKAYKKDFSFSYASGVFATLELLTHRPKEVQRVFVNSKGEPNKGIPEIRRICEQHSIPVETADSLVIKLSGSENCYAIGVFTKYEETLGSDTNHILLVNPSDMGNVGTIIRTMIGFDFRDLAIITPAVDLFDPKVIRSSTGAFFQMHFQQFPSFSDYKKAFGSHALYPFMLNGDKKLQEVTFTSPYTMIFGNEGAGLDEVYRSYGTSVVIPHSKTIDSLNLSMSAGIAFYQSGNFLDRPAAKNTNRK